jgi:hypothetical protein
MYRLSTATPPENLRKSTCSFERMELFTLAAYASAALVASAVAFYVIDKRIHLLADLQFLARLSPPPLRPRVSGSLASDSEAQDGPSIASLSRRDTDVYDDGRACEEEK